MLTIIKIIAILLSFIIILSLIQFLISIHPPKYTSKINPSDFNLSYENVSFLTSDKINIKGWLIPSKSNSTIIIGHGYPFDKSNILPVVKFLHPKYNLLLYDHRYFGESSGFITTVGLKETEDIHAAVEFIHNKFGKNHKIALYGFSLSASTMLMSNESVNAIIADSPYSDLSNMIKHIYKTFGPLKYPFIKTTELLSIIFFGKYPKLISPASSIKNTNTPIMVIHAEKDTQIPVENAYIIKKSNPNIELWIVPNADHGEAITLYKEEYQKRVNSFLNKHMK